MPRPKRVLLCIRFCARGACKLPGFPTHLLSECQRSGHLPPDLAIARLPLQGLFSCIVKWLFTLLLYLRGRSRSLAMGNPDDLRELGYTMRPSV